MLNQLPLNSIWGSLGANFEIIDDWWIPETFKDLPEEHQAAAAKKFLADVSFLGKVRVSGADHLSFLHNILTQDIKSLVPGQGALAALLTATGKTLMLMDVHRFDGYTLLIVETGMASKTIELLDKFLITEEVRFEDATSDYALLETSENLTTPYSLTPVLGRSRVLIPSKDAVDFTQKLITTSPFQPIGRKTMEILRIEKGIPRYGADVDETIILSETGLEDLAASETKGCYPGQEVIAKIKTYGRLNRKIMGFLLEEKSLPSKGDKIVDLERDKEAGWITSSCFSPALGRNIALGYLTREFFDENRKMLIQSKKAFKALSTPLPFPGQNR
jgi:aminomethyltransferase